MIQFAYATDGTTAAGAGNMTSTIIMIVVMIAIFYFLLIRPENKRKKQAEEMRNSLKKGDWLTTIGGIYGRVVSITDRTVVIETSEDRVRMEFVKSAIGSVGTLDQQMAAAQRPAGGSGRKPQAGTWQRSPCGLPRRQGQAHRPFLFRRPAEGVRQSAGAVQRGVSLSESSAKRTNFTKCQGLSSVGEVERSNCSR